MASFVEKIGREVNEGFVRLGRQVNRTVGIKNKPVEQKFAGHTAKANKRTGVATAGLLGAVAGYFAAPAIVSFAGGITAGGAGKLAGDAGGFALKGAGTFAAQHIADRLKGTGAQFTPEYLAARLQTLGPQKAQDEIEAGRLTVDSLNEDYSRQAGVDLSRGELPPTPTGPAPSPLPVIALGALALILLMRR